MTPVHLRKISKSYDDRNFVIRDLDLDIRPGEFMVFVGPSGCGKTTLLRMIAGLEEITDGEIFFGEQCVNELEPSERGAAMVFQSYALYPHMTVAENIGFGLRMTGVAKSARERMVQDVAKTLQIAHLLDRKPKSLSGGQRQRVAIGRAIVRKPKVFLFDEPLSNLDAALRVQMRLELARMHKQLGTTMIYVTHDQVEAMTLGQRIAVFNQGRIEQIGTPLDLYDHPANRFVAQFIGSPNMNILPATLDADGFAQIAAAGKLRLSNLNRSSQSLATIGIRPEDFVVGSANAPNSLNAQVGLIEHLGDTTVMHLEIVGIEGSLAAKLAGSVSGYEAGSRVGLSCAAERIHCFDERGQAIR
jgi:multiple sugar transport system ATP-binding protein